MAKLSPPITPVEIPRRVRTLIVFGGSFDPPHFYHTVAPLMVNRMYGEKGWVLYVPAARSPLKAGGPAAADEHRLAMLKLALDTPGPRSIWTDEIDRAAWLRERGRDGPSYTIDTLKRLRRVLPERVSMRLLIGADQAADFHRWKAFREIIRMAEPLVMAREPVVMVSSLFSSLDRDAWTREERAAWCTRMAPNFPMAAASTGLREAIAGGPAKAESWKDRPPLNEVTTNVAAYIIEHNLYRFRKGGPKPPAADVRARAIYGDSKAGRRALDVSFRRNLIAIGQKIAQDVTPPAKRTGGRTTRRGRKRRS